MIPSLLPQATPTTIQMSSPDNATLTPTEPSEASKRQFASLLIAADTARFVKDEMRRNPGVMERLRRL